MQLASGVLSGAGAAHGTYSGVMDAIVKTWQRDGFLAFYSGEVLAGLWNYPARLARCRSVAVLRLGVLLSFSAQGGVILAGSVFCLLH